MPLTACRIERWGGGWLEDGRLFRQAAQATGGGGVLQRSLVLVAKKPVYLSSFAHSFNPQSDTLREGTEFCSP